MSSSRISGILIDKPHDRASAGVTPSSPIAKCAASGAPKLQLTRGPVRTSPDRFHDGSTTINWQRQYPYLPPEDRILPLGRLPRPLFYKRPHCRKRGTFLAALRPCSPASLRGVRYESAAHPPTHAPHLPRAEQLIRWPHLHLPTRRRSLRQACPG